MMRLFKPLLLVCCLRAPVLGQRRPAYPLPTTNSYLIIPAAASIHGLGGSFFQTDLWIMNQSYTLPVDVNLQYFPSAFADGIASSTISTLAPREARLLADVVQSQFGRPESAGAILISWPLPYQRSLPLTATSRTYSSSRCGGGTYGMGVPATSYGYSDNLFVFVGLANGGGDLTSGYRSNVGAVNANGLFYESPWATVTFALYDEGGRPLGLPITRLVGWTAQVTDIFRAVGAESLITRNATLVVLSDTSVFAYVTVIDNQTGDSTFLPGSPDPPRS